MSKLKDLTGQKFGRLTVIERVENKGRYVAWKCRCDCGNEVIVRGDVLKCGRTKSCGCLHNEAAVVNVVKNHKHKKSGKKIYKIWQNMKKRCFNTNSNDYQRYGGRGITVYDEWIHNFQAFYDYVSQLPHFGEKGYSLDRIDNNGNYEPDNVRWADAKTQCRNRRSNCIVEYNGKSMTLAESSEKSGIAFKTLRDRYKRGDTGDRLFRPVETKK